MKTLRNDNHTEGATMKKNKVLRIIVLLFLIPFSVLELLAFWHYIEHFINGFTPSDFVGNVNGDTVYGFQAIKQDFWTHLIAFPTIHLASVFQILYGRLCVKGDTQKKRLWEVLSVVLVILNIALWVWVLN